MHSQHARHQSCNFEASVRHLNTVNDNKETHKYGYVPATNPSTSARLVKLNSEGALPDCSSGFLVGSVIIPDNEVDLNGSVDSEVGDLTDDAGRAVDVEDSLVDFHLITIPGVGSITTRRTSGGDGQAFGGHAVGSLGFVSLVLGSSNNLSTGGFERLNQSGGQGHDHDDSGYRRLH